MSYLMKIKQYIKCGVYSTLLLAVLFTCIIASPAIPPVGANATAHPVIFGPDSKAYGLTLGEWGARWHTWLYSIPGSTNPANDKTGKYCAQSQSGPAWFLAGTTGGSADRTCTIPAGKAILFPIIASECSYAENPDLKTQSQLLTCALGPDDTVKHMDLSIDGVSIPNLVKYRAHSSLFNFTFTKDNLGGVSPGPTQGVADGYWILIPPMSPGKHTIHFTALALEPSTTAAPTSFVIDVTYHLIIK